MTRLNGTVIFLLLMAASLSTHAAMLSEGDLTVAPLGVTQCPGLVAATQGEQLQLSGSGYLPNGSVDIEFNCCGTVKVALGTAVVDGSGDLSTTVTVPSSFVAPEISDLYAVGPHPNSSFTRLLSATLWIGPPSATDTDGDGSADYCDVCPLDNTTGQLDDDGDGLGNACDPCPLDYGNDADGDGACPSDVPPDTCPFDADNDIDGDAICGDEDNCPTVANFDQLDSDRNGIGDACQGGIATCSDGVDNDDDGRTDFRSDKGCEDANDTTETNASLPCDDGLDNDADGLIDFKLGSTSSDPGCGFDRAAALPENPECDDGIDNDGDGYIDWDGDYALTDPDPECQGFGFATTELVPEPGFLLGLLSGVALLSGLGHWRSERRSPRAEQPQALR